jgi:hypothetical protein
MAFNTFSLWDMAIALNNAKMALLTGYSSCNIFSMIEVPTFDLDITLGLHMAGGTSSYGT